MAEETDPESKTEEPTPRRREEARRQGSVPFSSELVGSVVLLAGVIALRYVGPDLGSVMMNVFREDLRNPIHADLTSDGAKDLFVRVVRRIFVVLVPLFVVLMSVGIAASVAQVGFQLNSEKLALKFDRLNPVSGMSRLFSMPSLFRGFLTILKVVALGAVAYWIIEGRSTTITGIPRDRLPGAAMASWALVMRLALYLVAAVAGVSILDYFFQRRRFERNLRMSRQELKDEMKQEEGDPHIKARIRQIQRDRMRHKMLREVPKATVVITNPTHYAVAIRYTTGHDAAPVVIAKGMGIIALRIAKLASEHKIPVLERPELARAIYSGVQEGQPIPSVLFRAVAEVLAFVYRLKGIGPTPAQLI